MYYLRKLYYQIVDKETINLYRLILLIEEYKNAYYHHVKNNRGEYSMMDKMHAYLYFSGNKTKYHNWNTIINLQRKIEDTYEEICKRPEAQNYKIHSEKFKEFYIVEFYHLQQEPDTVIKWIKNDILYGNNHQTTVLIPSEHESS